MPKSVHQVLVVDIESTCWKDKAPPNETSDIIEIGIVPLRVFELSLGEKRSILIKPTRSKISEFCTKLTSLKEEDFENAMSLAEGYRVLEKEYESKSYMWASYGQYDRLMFEKSCKDLDISYPLSNDHLNIKSLFACAMGLHYTVGMSKALKLLNLELEGTHHRGPDDAWNIARILKEIFKRIR